MFVTLFNLQGAHRSSAAGFYLTTSFRLCQELFSSFLNFFVPSSVAVVVCCCRNGFTSYHTFQPLSSTFFDFFQNLFLYPLALSAFRRVLSDSFDRLPRISSFVNTFFQIFFFFSTDPHFPLYFPIPAPENPPLADIWPQDFPLRNDTSYDTL